MKTVAIIQARMDSSRLPNKAIKLIGQYPSIYHVGKRTQLAVPDTVFVTTARKSDDPIAAVCESYGFLCHRADRPVSDLLGRYYDVAKAHHADLIVRVSGDEIFIVPKFIRHMVTNWRVNRLGPYEEFHYPDTPYHGSEFQVFEMDLLEHAEQTVSAAYEREYFVLWMRRLYNMGPGTDKDEIARSKLRCVLDTPTDLEWFRKVAGVLDIEPPYPTVDQITEAIKNNTIPGNYND
jgi:glutamate-1-semialdehyde 2,1-aminomutase